MTLKYFLWAVLCVLLIGSAIAATDNTANKADKVLVVTYGSTEEMLQDLGKVKESIERNGEKEVVEEKTWIHCTRYQCYRIPMITTVVSAVPVVSVRPMMRMQSASRYRYNPVDGKYINPWDEQEEYYRFDDDRYRFDDYYLFDSRDSRRFKHCRKYRDDGETYYRCYR